MAELVKKIISNITLVIAISYALGFMIWNTYLYQLGFSEYQILQTKFIPTGILYLLYILPIYGFIKFIFYKPLKIFTTNAKKYYDHEAKKYGDVAAYSQSIWILASLVIISIFFFTKYVFYKVPYAIAGASPRVLGIVAEDYQIEYLTNFGIDRLSEVQTSQLCIAYENSDYIIILLKDRVLQINKENIKGFISLPSKETADQISNCKELVEHYITKESSLELMEPYQSQSPEIVQ